jgi:hypothetical protein
MAKETVLDFDVSTVKSLGEILAKNSWHLGVMISKKGGFLISISSASTKAMKSRKLAEVKNEDLVDGLIDALALASK